MGARQQLRGRLIDKVDRDDFMVSDDRVEANLGSDEGVRRRIRASWGGARQSVGYFGPAPALRAANLAIKPSIPEALIS
jgi:hypothetical protein